MKFWNEEEEEEEDEMAFQPTRLRYARRNVRSADEQRSRMQRHSTGTGQRFPTAAS
jgi:hypothetical protein